MSIWFVMICLELFGSLSYKNAYSRDAKKAGAWVENPASA
jgi:hypothetical protein